MTDFQIAPINGEPGILTIVFGQPFSATVFDIEGEKILRVYQVMNPEKLKSFVDAGAVKKSI